MIEATVTNVVHRMLGPLKRLAIGPAAAWDLTQQEAATLAKAMTAVRHDRGRTDEIYLSPQASDGEFVAKVTHEGLLVAATGSEVLVGWPAVAILAEGLST